MGAKAVRNGGEDEDELRSSAASFVFAHMITVTNTRRWQLSYHNLLSHRFQATTSSEIHRVEIHRNNRTTSYTCPCAFVSSNVELAPPALHICQLLRLLFPPLATVPILTRPRNNCITINGYHIVGWLTHRHRLASITSTPRGNRWPFQYCMTLVR